MRRIIVVLAIAAQSFALGVFAGETQTCIVVFSHHGELKDAAVTAAGGVVMSRAAEYLVATLTDDGAEELLQNKSVLYLQRVGEPEPAGAG